MSEDHILITRYSSRRLYNTHSSEYITLEEVYSLIKEGKNIKIIDKQTQEDLTKQYLLQIISDIENKEGNVFPCVFTAKNILVAKINPYEETDILYDWKSNNCKVHGLKKIFTNKFFTSYFTNKLKLDPSLICNKKCGVLK